MIEIKNLTLQRGSKILLDNATATINPRQRVGLIGKNGTGKSSLFALIKGEIGQDKGDLLLPKTWKLAAVAQETPALDTAALDYVLQGDAELQHFQAALAAAHAAATAFAVFVFFLVVQNGQFPLFGGRVFLLVDIVYLNGVFAHGFSLKAGLIKRRIIVGLHDIGSLKIPRPLFQAA